MLLNAEREVSLLIELALSQAVAGGFEGEDEKILSSLSPQGQLCTDRLLLLDAEGGKSLLGKGPDGLLVGNRLHDGLSVNQPLAALSDAQMHDNLVDTGLKHDIHLTAPNLMTG